MATKAKANKSAAKSATSKATGSAKPQSKKATKAVETVETVETVEQSNETPIAAKSADITATPEMATEPKAHTCSTCGVGEQTNDKGELNFSVLQDGKTRTICKPCQTAKSGEWTTAKKDYRKAYARSQFFIQRGIAAVAPTAKEWTPEYVIMTVKRNDEGVIVTDRPAEEVYAEQVAAAKAVREANKANKLAIAEAAKADRKVEREAAKAVRDAKRLADAETAQVARDAAKALKTEQRAEKATQAKADKEAASLKKADEKAAANLKKANELKVARDKKAADRAAAALQNSLDKAAKVAEAKTAQIDAGNAKAIAALSKNTQTATV